MGPLISVVMAVCNTGPYLGAAIESVLGQTESDFEFIIIDDGSDDDTADIILGMSDRRIRLISNAVNRGVPYSVNKGLDAARGEFIARMDGDDICLPRRFERQVEFMRTHPDIAACGTWGVDINAEGIEQGPHITWTGRKLAAFSLLPSPILNPSSMIRTAIAKELRYNERFNVGQDYDFWLRLQKNHRIANLPESLLQYRVHRTSLTGRFRLMQRDKAHESFCENVMPIPADVFVALLSQEFVVNPAVRWKWMQKLAAASGVHASEYWKNQATYTRRWSMAKVTGRGKKIDI